MIEIRPLTNIVAEEINRLTGPFVCDEVYRVHYEDSPERTNFSVELTPAPEPHWHNYSHLDDAYIQENLSHADFSFGAYDGNALVGVLIAEKRAWNDSLWVMEFHVEPARRRQGIGRQLMEHAAERAREAGLRTIVCETQNTNAVAIQAYRRLGFRLEGIDISYYTNQDYPDKDVAVFMKLRLFTLF